MKFKEELIAKIFTLVTVTVLLGIVIFEAWSLQAERGRRAEAEEEAESVQESLQKLVNVNAQLQERNTLLDAFQKEWSPYAAFMESKEVLTLKEDLFKRPELIPEDAIRALAQSQKEQNPEDGLTEAIQQEEDRRDVHTGKEEGEGETQEEPEDESWKELTMAFREADGNESPFLAMSTGIGDRQACMVYTAAYEEKSGAAMELIFEIPFVLQRSVADRDENGEYEWNCVAFNIGGGWRGFPDEEPEIETVQEPEE